jgi:hypothetical protein
MKHTTIRDLEAATRVLNQLVGATAATPGAYYLQGAYGGWQLQQLVGPHGACIAIFPGYRSKRELLELIHAFRAGIRVGQETAPVPATN